MANVNFEIKEHVGTIATKKNGWTKELNIVSWNNGKAKYDIREWDEDYERMSKGTTFTEEELENLFRILKSKFES